MRNNKAAAATPLNTIKRRSRRAFRFAFVSAFWFTASLSVLILSFLFFFQFSQFRSYAIPKILSLVNDALIAKVEADDIILTGFPNVEVVGARMICEGDTLASVSRLFVEADLLALLNNEINVRTLCLQSPRIKLLRNSNTGVWNFERIAPPSKEPSKPSTAETLLKVKDLIIDNASIDFIDSLSMKNHAYQVRPGAFNFDCFKLRDFALVLSADFNLKKLTGLIDIRQIQFHEKISGLNLYNLALKATLKDKGAEINKLRIKTDRSDVDIQAMVSDLSLSKPIDAKLINKMGVYLRMNKSKVAFKDIDMFARTNLGIEASPDISIEASGRIDDLKIKKLKLNTGESEINFSGYLKRLISGPEIEFYVDMQNSRMSKKDLSPCLPKGVGDGIPDFGDAIIHKIKGGGVPSKIEAEVDIKSALGNIAGKAGVDFKSGFHYHADVKVENVDIAKIASSPSLASSISGKIKAEGSEVDLKKIKASLQLDLSSSKFQSFDISAMKLRSNLDGGKIYIDTLSLTLPDKTNSGESYLNVHGALDIFDFNEPVYDVNVDFKGLNVASLTNNPQAPQYCSASIKVGGVGFNPDNMRTKLSSHWSDIVFGDKSIMPFDLNVDIDTKVDQEKFVIVNSDWINIDLKGEFTIAALATFGENQGRFWAMSVFNKMGKIENPNFIPEYYNKPLIPAKFKLKADVKDLSAANAFLPHEKLYADINIEANGEISENGARMDISKFDVSNFQFDSKYYTMQVSDIGFSGFINIHSDGATYKLDTANLYMSGDGYAKIMDLLIERPRIAVKMNNENIKYIAEASFNKTFFIANSGEISFVDSKMLSHSDSLAFEYGPAIKIYNDGDMDLELSNGSLIFKNANFQMAHKELITVKGSSTMNYINGVELTAKKVSLRAIDSVLQYFGASSLKMFDGSLNNFRILASGPFANPEYKIEALTDNFYINKKKVGIMDVNFYYNNKNIEGSVFLMDSVSRKRLFSARVESFPIDLSIGDSLGMLRKGSPISIKASSDSMPVNVAQPFIPAIADLNGNMAVDLNIYGSDIENLKYAGSIDIPYARFNLLANNLNYSLKAKIGFDNSSIVLKDAIVVNDPSDLKGGYGSISGQVDMNGFQVDKFNFTFKSKSIKALSQASSKAQPMIYGDVIVATGKNPISVKGDLSYLNINGDVNILDGKLFMPQLTNRQNSGSSMLYKVLAKTKDGATFYKVIDIARGDTLYTMRQNIVDTLQLNKQKNIQPKEDIANNISMNINFKILKPVELKMDLGPLGWLDAMIGVANKNLPLNFDYNSKSDIKLNGDIQLLDGSKLTYLKKFDTQGKISFPYGKVSEPLLNLKATYVGKSYINEKSRDFKVYFYLTGAKDNLHMKVDYEIDGQPAKGDSSQISQDGLYLVALGRTKAEIESGTSAGGNDFGSIGMSGVTAAFTKTLSELLAGTGAVQSAEIDMAGTNNWEDARIKLTGQIFNNLTWKYGSSLNDLTANNEFSLDIPLGIVLHPDYLNNIVLQISRSANTQQTTTNRNQKEWEVLFKFGGAW
jgi:hypothetical protein